MSLRRPPKPSAIGAPNGMALFDQATWEMLHNGKFPFGSTDTIRVSYKGGYYFFEAKPQPAAGGKGNKLAITGEWDPTRVYNFLEVVIISTGDNAGSYVYINQSSSSGHSPWAGGGWWMQLGQFQTWI